MGPFNIWNTLILKSYLLFTRNSNLTGKSCIAPDSTSPGLCLVGVFPWGGGSATFKNFSQKRIRRSVGSLACGLLQGSLLGGGSGVGRRG